MWLEPSDLMLTLEDCKSFACTNTWAGDFNQFSVFHPTINRSHDSCWNYLRWLTETWSSRGDKLFFLAREVKPKMFAESNKNKLNELLVDFHLISLTNRRVNDRAVETDEMNQMINWSRAINSSLFLSSWYELSICVNLLGEKLTGVTSIEKFPFKKQSEVASDALELMLRFF